MNMNNNFFAQAEIFVEIVRQGSITAAAQSLGLSKSSVSQKLSEMERDLDILLFRRTTRSLDLTPAGQKLYTQCAPAVDAVAEARSEISPHPTAKNVSGTVTLAGSNIYLTEFVLPHIPDLQAQYPEIRLQLTGSDRPLNQREENIDLRFRIGAASSSGARIFLLQPLKRVICASATLSSYISSPEELEDQPVILREQERPLWQFLRAKEQTEVRISQPQMRVNSYELLLQAVRSGLGIAMVARAVIEEDLETGRLVQLLPDWQIKDLPVSLIVPHSRLRKPAVQATARFFAEQLT